MKTNHYALPQLSLRFIPIWRRNYMVWKKMAGPSILGHLADPVIYCWVWVTAWAGCCLKSAVCRISLFCLPGRCATAP